MKGVGNRAWSNLGVVCRFGCIWQHLPLPAVQMTDVDPFPVVFSWQDPAAFAAASAPAEVATEAAPAAAAPKEAEKAAEPEEESDGEMGFSLFDD